MKKITVVLAILMIAVLVAGCGAPAAGTASNTPAPSATPSAAPAATPAATDKPAADNAFKAALIVTDSINDAGWNAAAYAGLKSIESEMGAEINYSEKVALPDAEPALRDYANKGYNIIFCHSMEYGESVMKVAPDYPNTKFAVYTGSVEAANVCSISLDEHETGYLAGMLAASMSKTGKVGVIIGSDFPSLVRISEAYKLGAKAVNPNVTVFDVFIGTWDDMAKGKEAAISQIENGADVIFHVADKAGLGAIQAAQEKKVYAIGSSTDQSSVAPGTVISSAVDFAGQAYLAVAKSVKDGTFKGGVAKAGLKDKAIDMAPFDKAVPESVVKLINDTKAKIISGELVVPEILARTTK